MYVRDKGIILGFALLISGSAWGMTEVAFNRLQKDYAVIKRDFASNPLANADKIQNQLNTIRNAISQVKKPTSWKTSTTSWVNSEQKFINNTLSQIGSKRTPEAAPTPATGPVPAGLPAPEEVSGSGWAPKEESGAIAPAASGSQVGGATPRPQPAPAASGSGASPKPQAAPAAAQLNPKDPAAPFIILGLPYGATDAQILGLSDAQLNDKNAVKKAYRALALIWHPNNRNVQDVAKARYAQPDVRNLSPEDKETLANNVFKVINDANQRVMKRF